MKTTLAIAIICLCSVLASASATLRGARELRTAPILTVANRKWTAPRKDGRCGPKWGMAGCDPEGPNPCCNYHKKTARCGATRRFCKGGGKREWGVDFRNAVLPWETVEPPSAEPIAPEVPLVPEAPNVRLPESNLVARVHELEKALADAKKNAAAREAALTEQLDAARADLDASKDALDASKDALESARADAAAAAEAAAADLEASKNALVSALADAEAAAAAADDAAAAALAECHAEVDARDAEIAALEAAAREQAEKEAEEEAAEKACPQRCGMCKAGGRWAGAGRPLDSVSGKCTFHCSVGGYCGVGEDYEDGGTDCSKCPRSHGDRVRGAAAAFKALLAGGRRGD